jgi:hypothetical protein
MTQSGEAKSYPCRVPCRFLLASPHKNASNIGLNRGHKNVMHWYSDHRNVGLLYQTLAPSVAHRLPLAGTPQCIPPHNSTHSCTGFVAFIPAHVGGVVTIYTTRLNIPKILRSAHTVYLCFVWIWEQRLFPCSTLSGWFNNRDGVFTARYGLNIYHSTILRSAHTVYLCGYHNKQRLFPYTVLTDWFV